MAETHNNAQLIAHPHARTASRSFRAEESVSSRSQRGDAARATAARGNRNPARSHAGRRTNFMKYANDNRVVRAIYAITTGPQRVLFYAVVACALLAYVYGPVRDLYVSYRTGDILAKQEAIQQEYKDGLETEVESYLSEQGIEEAARKQGMVMPGERSITVTGDGSSTDSSSRDSASSSSADAASSSDSGALTTASQVEAAEQKAYADAPWYVKALDRVFFFSGVEGQAVVSAGDASTSSSSS